MGTIANSGTLNAAGRLLRIAERVSGKGIKEIGGADTLSLLQGVGSGQIVDFRSIHANLDLADASDFLGRIAGFGGSDVTDLLRIAETGFGFSNGVLTVKIGTAMTAALDFRGTYTQSDFHLTRGSHGGTLIKFV